MSKLRPDQIPLDPTTLEENAGNLRQVPGTEGSSDVTLPINTSDVTGLDTALSGKAASAHAHVISDVTGLQSALDAKIGTSGAGLKIASGIHTGLSETSYTIITFGVTFTSAPVVIATFKTYGSITAFAQLRTITTTTAEVIVRTHDNLGVTSAVGEVHWIAIGT